MTVVIVTAFWTAMGILFWAYLGYPLFVATVAPRVLSPTGRTNEAIGGTLLLISAYNEELGIDAKLSNAVELETVGPTEIVVVSDASTDGTDAIVQQWSDRDDRVRLVRVEPRRGKNGALNEAIRRLRPPPDHMVVFTDANAVFDTPAPRRLAAALEGGAACAVGRLDFVDAVSGTARAEGLYWRYENRLKAMEGRMGRNAFANGAIFASRVKDVPHLPADVGNDFWIPITLLGQGRRVIYEPAARASEPAPHYAGEEFRRKARMATRQMTGVIRAWPGVDNATRFQLVSHKVLRWLALPILALALGMALLLWEHALYRSAGVLLLSPALLAVLALLLRPARVRVPAGQVAVHFFLVQTAALLGVIAALRGKRRVTWEAAESSRRSVT